MQKLTTVLRYLLVEFIQGLFWGLGLFAGFKLFAWAVLE